MIDWADGLCHKDGLCFECVGVCVCRACVCAVRVCVCRVYVCVVRVCVSCVRVSCALKMNAGILWLHDTLTKTPCLQPGKGDIAFIKHLCELWLFFFAAYFTMSIYTGTCKSISISYTRWPSLQLLLEAQEKKPPNNDRQRQTWSWGLQISCQGRGKVIPRPNFLPQIHIFSRGQTGRCPPTTPHSTPTTSLTWERWSCHWLSLSARVRVRSCSCARIARPRSTGSWGRPGGRPGSRRRRGTGWAPSSHSPATARRSTSARAPCTGWRGPPRWWRRRAPSTGRSSPW